jgi:hypothetical protein
MLGLIALVVALGGGVGIFVMADPPFKPFGLLPIGLAVSVEAWARISPESCLRFVGTTGTGGIYLAVIGVKLGAIALAVWGGCGSPIERVIPGV